MVDQIQEQTALDHVEATGTALRRMPWNWVVGIALGVAIIIATSAILFLVFAGRSNTADPATKKQADIAPAVPQVQLGESQTAPVAPVDYPNAANVWERRSARPTDMVLADIGSQPTATGVAFAHKVLPQLQGLETILVAIAGDPVDKNVVFATISAVDDRVWQEERMKAARENREAKPTDSMFVWSFYLLLSVDGEKSWHELAVVPTTASTPLVVTVGVKIDGDSTYAVARDAKLSENESWWETTLKRSELAL